MSLDQFSGSPAHTAKDPMPTAMAQAPGPPKVPKGLTLFSKAMQAGKALGLRLRSTPEPLQLISKSPCINKTLNRIKEQTS